jgi:hypothetical protein
MRLVPPIFFKWELWGATELLPFEMENSQSLIYFPVDSGHLYYLHGAVFDVVFSQYVWDLSFLGKLISLRMFWMESRGTCCSCCAET